MIQYFSTKLCLVDFRAMHFINRETLWFTATYIKLLSVSYYLSHVVSEYTYIEESA